jgi:hypothetical protein
MSRTVTPEELEELRASVTTLFDVGREEDHEEDPD